MEYLAIQIIESLPASVRRLTADLDDEQLHFRPAAHEWSIVEITGHLIDKTEVWGERLRRVAAEDRPFLPVYDQNAYVHDRRYQEQQHAPLLQRLTAMTTALAGDLRSFNSAAWVRMGVHEERGPLTLGELCRFFAAGIPEHIGQMVTTRDAALTAHAAEPE